MVVQGASRNCQRRPPGESRRDHGGGTSPSAPDPFVCWCDAAASHPVDRRLRDRRRVGRGAARRTAVGGVALLATLGLAASACGGSNGAAGYGPYPASLPSASTLCPTLAEVDYYVPVPASAASGVVEQSTTAGVRSTVRCVYGDPRHARRDTPLSVTMVLRPTATETRPSGVAITEGQARRPAQ